MSNQQDEQTENLRELLKQHWLHARHIESERAWFMNVYAIVTGGILAYAFMNGTLELWPIYFLIAFTAIGLLLNIRWRQAFNHHRDKVEGAAEDLGIKATDEKSKYRVWVSPSKCIILKTGYLFIFFYAITLIGLISLVILVKTEVIQA